MMLFGWFGEAVVGMKQAEQTCLTTVRKGPHSEPKRLPSCGCIDQTRRDEMGGGSQSKWWVYCFDHTLMAMGNWRKMSLSYFSISLSHARTAHTHTHTHAHVSALSHNHIEHIPSQVPISKAQTSSISSLNFPCGDAGIKFWINFVNSKIFE